MSIFTFANLGHYYNSYQNGRLQEAARLSEEDFFFIVYP